MFFGRTIVSISVLFALTSAARADEGLERINELGDQGLVSQSANNATKKKAKSKGETYKAVEEDDAPASNAFKGTPPAQDNNVFLGIGTGFFAGFNLQGRYAYRVLKQGFIPDLNNSFSVEGGLGLNFYGSQTDGKSATGFEFLAAGRWDFQYDQSWVFFGELGLGGSAVSNSEGSNVRGGSMFPVVGVGAMYNVNTDWAVRADLGYEFTGIGVVHRF